MFPRGGGVWDQDPILMRDFRVIARSEREWRDIKDGGNGTGGLGLQELMKQHLDELGEDGAF